MISQKFLSSILLLLAAICILQCYSSPVPSEVESSDSPSQREGRFYGLAGSQASAMASAGAGGFGYPGFGGSNAFASASANAGAMGYPYGK